MWHHVTHYVHKHWRGITQVGLWGAGIVGAVACGVSVVCAAVVGGAVAGASYTAGNAGSKRWRWGSFITNTVVGGVTAGVGRWGLNYRRAMYYEPRHYYVPRHYK